MRIAITDANVFIDLIYAELHEELFAIELEIHTTHNVFYELNEKQQSILSKFVKKKQLTLHSQEELKLSDDIKNNKRLSDSDKSVFSLAVELDAFILTGDGLLRKISRVQMIEVHGVLWLFDRFLEKKFLPRKRRFNS